MNKNSKYRELLDSVKLQITRAEIGVTGVYQLMLETLDKAEKDEGELKRKIEELEVDNKMLINALEAVKIDLLERANIDSRDSKVVELGLSVWVQLKDTLKLVKG